MMLRRGGALVIALALLALGAALLAGSAEAGRASARSAESHEARLLADGESRLAAAAFMDSWSAAADALTVGAGIDDTFPPRARGSAGAPVVTRAHLRRLSAERYVLVVECEVGGTGGVLARRRLQLLLQRPQAADTAPPSVHPTMVSQWAVTSMF
ncbi:MAG: hypothetical protein ABJA80_04870 [bacterium]